MVCFVSCWSHFVIWKINCRLNVKLKQNKNKNKIEHHIHKQSWQLQWSKCHLVPFLSLWSTLAYFFQFYSEGWSYKKKKKTSTSGFPTRIPKAASWQMVLKKKQTHVHWLIYIHSVRETTHATAEIMKVRPSYSQRRYKTFLPLWVKLCQQIRSYNSESFLFNSP